VITEEQLKDLETLIGEFPAKPAPYSYEGQIGSGRKSNGYVGYHVHSICGGPMRESATEKHYCIGNVIAKDEDTVARLACLIGAAPDLLAEVVRLRAALANLADGEQADKRIEDAVGCGGDGVHCAVKEVQQYAHRALFGGE